MDISYTFYNPIISPNQTIVDGIGGEMPFYKAAAVSMQSYIASFIVYGDPNAAGLTGFPVYGSGQVLIFNDSSSVIVDPTANERCTWWQTGAYMNNTT